jgi:para-nitrobenzyl esterase
MEPTPLSGWTKIPALNIWTPAKCADEKITVMCGYFGGGFRKANTAVMEFDGERIARRGIVVVSITTAYVFGFLCHPDITKVSPEAPANFGLLDRSSVPAG